MVRDFVYTSDISPVLETLGHFTLTIPNERYAMALLRFEVLTPDAFIWRLLIADQIYYLYAEDYIPSLHHVTKVFSSYLGNTNWNLVTCKKPGNFCSSSPVIGATVDKEPDDADELMRYAVGSGHDFVFLARSSEDGMNALFSEDAPRGFVFEN